MNIFEKDLSEANSQLIQEQKKGFWKKLFTLGILNNDSEIEKAKKSLQLCSEDLEKSRQLNTQAQEIDRHEETIIFHGIRISKHTFADNIVLDKESYPEEWNLLRQKILERDNYSCQERDGYCGGPLQIHHEIPLSRGGSNNPSNLTTLCKFHHSMKHPHMQQR